MTIPADSWLHRKEELGIFARSMDKSTKLVVKKSGIWGLSKALRTYATTIGRTVYIPEEWTYAHVKRVLPHEVLGHVVQFRYCGLGIHPTLGIFPGMFFIYVWGIFFPIFLAWGRYRMELHAETKAWKYHLKQEYTKATIAWVRFRAKTFPTKVGGKEYVFSVPKFWAVWGFKRRAEKVINGFQGTAALAA